MPLLLFFLYAELRETGLGVTALCKRDTSLFCSVSSSLLKQYLRGSVMRAKARGAEDAIQLLPFRFCTPGR